MKPSKINLCFTTIVASFLMSTVSSAAVFTVNQTLDATDQTPGDGLCATVDGDCTLRAAIRETNALIGKDTIHVPTGDYRLTLGASDEDAAAEGDLDITDDLVVSGAGINQTAIIGIIYPPDGSTKITHIDRIFHILKRANQSTPAVLIENVTLKQDSGNSRSQVPFIKGVHIYNNGNLTLDNVTVTNRNSASTIDGASSIYNEYTGRLTVENSRINDNKIHGLWNNTGTVLIKNSDFSHNTPSFFSAGGAGAYNLGNMTIIDSTFGFPLKAGHFLTLFYTGRNENRNS